MSFLRRVGRVQWWVWASLLVFGVVLMAVGLGWFPLFLVGFGWLITALLRQETRSSNGPEVNEVIGRPQPIAQTSISQASNAELCELWAQSGKELRRAYLPSTILSHARLREALLDEMERRDPEAIDRWLADRPDQRDPRMYLEST